MNKIKVPFKTPVDYWVEILKRNPSNINIFQELIHSEEHKHWLKKYDCDLHIYPYIHAEPSLLSIGCNNQCPFCPTALEHKGKIHYGDYEIIIPKLENKIIHFMDENFFKNDMEIVLPLLKKYNVTWLAMSTYSEVINLLEKYSDDYLFDCGCRVIEMGLENVVLYKKVLKPIRTNKVEIYYLNMTFLEGETIETIKQNAKFMKECSLPNPIHHNNSLWYSGGQFFYPYEDVDKGKGMMLKPPKARVSPTFIPNSFLEGNFKITDLETVNFYNQLVYNNKFYPSKEDWNVKEFINSGIGEDWKLAQWLVTGIRSGGIV